MTNQNRRHKRQTWKQQKEYTAQEKEWNFARWFWNHGDSDMWNYTKTFVTLILCIFVAIIGYYAIYAVNVSNYLAAFIGVIILLGMAILVNTNLRNGFNKFFRKTKYEQIKFIKSYEGISYYFLKRYNDILFIENGQTLTGIGLFKLKAIPLMIHGNFERFVRALYQQQIPLYWIYGQAPIGEGAILATPAVSGEAREFYEAQDSFEAQSRLEVHGGMWGVRIIFGTRRTIALSGDLEEKRLILYKQLSADLFKIHTAFCSAYPHTVLELLNGKELEKAFSITITGGGLPAFF
ncbi:MAG: hypothetical protein ACTSQI_20455 [Candidatus Helarchaeota archaeon]